MFSVLLRYTNSDCLFGIFKFFLYIIAFFAILLWRDRGKSNNTKLLHCRNSSKILLIIRRSGSKIDTHIRHIYMTGHCPVLVQALQLQKRVLSEYYGLLSSLLFFTSFYYYDCNLKTPVNKTLTYTSKSTVRVG